MTRRAIALKWLLYALTAAVAVLLQNLILTPLHIGGVHPFLLPAAAVIPATREARGQSLLFAFTFGLLCDLTMPASFPCLYAAAFSLSALLSGIVARRLINPGAICSVAASTAALIVTDLLQLLSMAGSGTTDVLTGLVLTLHELAVSVVFFFPVHFLDYWVYRRTLSE